MHLALMRKMRNVVKLTEQWAYFHSVKLHQLVTMLSRENNIHNFKVINYDCSPTGFYWFLTMAAWVTKSHPPEVMVTYVIFPCMTTNAAWKFVPADQ